MQIRPEGALLISDNILLGSAMTGGLQAAPGTNEAEGGQN
jgi:hypothetical protein